MEEAEVNNTDVSITESVFNISPLELTKTHSRTQIEDDRIVCSNSKSLDNILQIVETHIKELGDSFQLDDPSEKTQFVSRVIEIFKVNIQENVTINGLPYSPNKELLSNHQKEEHKVISNDSVLSSLSKRCQVIAEKRKNYPKDFCKILAKRHCQDQHNIKKAQIQHSAHLPSLKEDFFQVKCVSPQELKKFTEEMKSFQTKIDDSLKEVKKLQDDINFAQEVITQKSYLDILKE